MNLSYVNARPVVHLLSGEPMIADLVQRLAGALDCDASIATAGEELRDRIVTSSPNCAVVPMDGSSATVEFVLNELPSVGLELPVIVITGDLPVEMVIRIIELGAYKVLYKTFSPELLRSLIEKAFQLDAERLSMRKNFLETQSSLSKLTERQLIVLRAILQGKTTKIISAEMNLSNRLIEKERSEILVAFGLKSTAEVTFRLGEYRVLRRMKNRFDSPHLKSHMQPHLGQSGVETAFEKFLQRFGEL